MSISLNLCKVNNLFCGIFLHVLHLYISLLHMPYVKTYNKFFGKLYDRVSEKYVVIKLASALVNIAKINKKRRKIQYLLLTSALIPNIILSSVNMHRTCKKL